jgi:hypothetical protein
VLNPLVAATESRDPDTLMAVTSVLGEIGYDVAVPYLVRVQAQAGGNNGVKQSVANALRQIPGGTEAAGRNPAELFYELSEKFYYENAAIGADRRRQTANVWTWDDRAGLRRQQVPPAIFNEVMAMRTARAALELGAGDDAESLWLAANNKREADLPAGGVDPTTADMPPAHYFNVVAGTARLNPVLARALRDRNAAVALKATRSLQGIGGQSNVLQGDAVTPLVDAMRSPDRLVRFEAAMALASALPQQPFNGQERVVPLLAEAVSQTGQPNVLYVVADANEGTRLAAELKGYGSAGGVGATGAMAAATDLPSIDVILIARDVNDDEVRDVLRAAAQDPRTERSAKVILRARNAGPWVRAAINDKTLTVTPANDAATLGPAIEEARGKVGGVPMDEKIATDYALRAAQLLAKLATSRGQVLDLAPAQQTLLAALSDKRPEIAKAVGDAVALTDAPPVQPALLDRAQDEQTAEDVRVSLYRSLATSAKFFGNRLPGGQVDALRGTVADATNLDVRSAAAEAFGALNLPTDDVKQLILRQKAPATAATPAQASATR